MSILSHIDKQKNSSIRRAIPEDKDALMAIADAIGLFQPDELEALGGMMEDYFQSDSASEPFWITYDDGNPVAVAYCALEPFTSGTWNVYFIVVHPARQREGLGAMLMDYIEQTLAKRGERVLLVETSGLPNLAQARAFYPKQGYEEEARIREFYKVGDDKIIFRKALTQNLSAALTFTLECSKEL